MTTSNLKDERAAFEVYAEGKGICVEKFESADGKVLYIAPAANEGWEAWQARATQASEVEQAPKLKERHEEIIALAVDTLNRSGHHNIATALRGVMLELVAPTTEQDKRDAETLDHGDVFTLIGLAKVLQGIGKDDTSRWCMELAERIALTIGDKELANRTAALAATAQSEGESK